MTLQTRLLLSWALVATFIIFLLGMKECATRPCNEVTAIERHTDTIHIDRPISYVVFKSKPKKVISRHVAAAPVNWYNFPFDTVSRPEDEPVKLCDSIRIYVDSVSRLNEYSAQINDTVIGERIGLGISFKNLVPIIRETQIIQAKKQAWVKVYGGVVAAGGKDYWSVQPAAQAVIMDRFSLLYSYDPRFNRHQAGAFVKISFRKDRW